jgi:RND superfamily putative drug exporter
MYLVPSVMKLLGDECWWAPRSLKWLHARIGLDEVGLRDSPTPVAMPEPKSEPEPEPEEALVGADASVPKWRRRPHDPTHPTVEGSSRSEVAVRLATTPSAATTTPMRPARSADADGDGDAASPTPREDREIQSWLDELGPPLTSAPGPAPATNGDDPDETTAVPTRLQQDPDIT